MLSLVLVVIVVGNVVLWSYQMNQVDWERTQESIAVVGAETIVQNWDQNPSDYSLLGSTTLAGGGVANLNADDSSYMTFRSYYSGTNIADFVNNNSSNVDSSANKGSESNFAAQQAGPDSTYDVLTEENTGVSSSFGSSTGSSNTIVSANDLYGSVFTSPADSEGATIQSITWYGSGYSGSGNAKAVLVLHSTLQIIAVSDPVSFTTFATERTNTFSSPPTITANTEYVLMMIFSVTTRLYYGSGSTNQGHVDTTNSYTTPTNPTDETHNNNQYRIRTAYYRPDNHELDKEVQWTNADFDEANEQLAIYANLGSNTHSLDATGGYMRVGSGTPNWGSTSGTISFWIKWDTVGGRPYGQHDNMEIRFEGSTLVLDWGAVGTLFSGTSFVSGKWYFIAVVWSESADDLFLYVGDQSSIPTQDAFNGTWVSAVSTQGVTQNDFMAAKGGVEPTDGHGDELRYWNTARSLAQLQSDYNIELTGSETNLRSYFKLNNNFDDIGPNNNDGAGIGSYSFSTDSAYAPTETIRVDVWTGSAWQNVLTDLANGWNNVSVSSYLTSQTFTIRFKGGSEISDTIQDQWYIDAVVLHVWTDEYTSEVEFTGVSNTENWTQLNWTVNTAWTLASVSVTIQLYNFTSGAYQTSGFGYAAYTSSATPNTDENVINSTSVRTTDFRNSTGGWKIKIKGFKSGVNQFDFKADFIEFSEEKLGGALVTFENGGALTYHVVSIWVINSTSHQRFEADTFVNSGENVSQSFSSINLPSGSYTIKAVTERGNMAILPVT